MGSEPELCVEGMFASSQLSMVFEANHKENIHTRGQLRTDSGPQRCEENSHAREKEAVR